MENVQSQKTKSRWACTFLRNYVQLEVNAEQNDKSMVEIFGFHVLHIRVVNKMVEELYLFIYFLLCVLRSDIIGCSPTLLWYGLCTEKVDLCA